MPTPYNEYLTPEEKANGNNLYDFKITGDIDKLTLKGGDPLKAYLGETPLTAKDMGDYYAYSDGNGHQWSYPKSKLEDNSTLNAYQRFENGWRNSSAYGFDKVMLGTLGLGISPFVAMEAVPYLATLANGSADAAMATRAGQLANRVLTSPYGKAGLSSVFGSVGLNNYFGPEGYRKTKEMWDTFYKNPDLYNAVNLGKSVLGDAMDISMVTPAASTAARSLNGVYNAGNQILSDYKTVLPKFINTVKNFNGASKVSRALKASSKIANPRYVNILAKSPEIMDIMKLYQYPDFSTKELSDFQKVWAQEAAKGPYSMEGGLQHAALRDLSWDGSNLSMAKNIEELPKLFDRARKLQHAVDVATRYGSMLGSKYHSMMDTLTDPVLRHIAETSPQYLPELVKQQQEYGGATEEFVKNLIKRSNSYRRFMSRPYTTDEFGTFNGSGLTSKGNLAQINVEGRLRSDVNGEYGKYPAFYEGQPNLTGDMSTWWDQRIPEGVDASVGMHTVLSPNVAGAYEKFLTILDTQNTFLPVDRAWRQAYKNSGADFRFVEWPAHQILWGEKGTKLPNFKITIGDKYGTIPEGFEWGKGYSYGGPLVAQANMLGDGGSSNDYNSWKQQIKDYKGIIVDGDNTYDYKRFYDENPDIAWDMLRDDPNAHFIDRYKTPYHPTYSDESLYSRSPFVQGGHWEELLYPTASGQKWNYQLSPSQVASNWDVARTLDYAANAEDGGFYVTDSQGRYPIFDGIVQGGVLPSVEVSNYEDGGSLNTYKQWQDLPIKERADIMKVAIRNGITNLADIKAKYNEFALGGQLEEPNLYGGGGAKNPLSSAYQKLNRINQLQAAGMTPQEAHAMQYYVDRGFAPHQAAGLVGGFVRESALDPTALNKNSGAYGIGQWLGPRKDALMKMYGNNPTFANELDYSMHELDNTTKEAKRRILSSSTPEEAATNAFNYYGAALDGNGVANMNRWGQDGQKSLQQGIDNAKRLYNLYSSVGFSDGGNMYSKGSWLRKKTQAISKATKIPTTSKKSTPMSNSSAYAMQYFINKGLAPHQAAGLVGNLMRESGLNPLAINPGSKAYGLAQWLGARKKKLFSMYGSKPTLQNQLDFVWWELNNTHKNGLKHLMAARNAEEAARAGMNWFEFSNGDAISEMNKWGQDGRGSMRKGIEFATKLAGQPMPDLAYLDTPNPNMQQSQTYGQMPIGYGYPMQQPQNDNNTFLAFEPSNPQAFFAPLSSYETPVEQPVTQPLVDAAEQQYKAEMAKRQRAMQQNNNMLALVSYLNNSGNQDSSPFGVFNLLSGSQIEV